MENEQILGRGVEMGGGDGGMEEFSGSKQPQRLFQTGL